MVALSISYLLFWLSASFLVFFSTVSWRPLTRWWAGVCTWISYYKPSPTTFSTGKFYSHLLFLIDQPYWLMVWLACLVTSLGSFLCHCAASCSLVGWVSMPGYGKALWQIRCKNWQFKQNLSDCPFSLSRFIRVGGYKLLNTWLTYSKTSTNTPLLQLILLTLQKLPLTVDHLKQNNTAKLVKQLSKTGETEGMFLNNFHFPCGPPSSIPWAD